MKAYQKKKEPLALEIKFFKYLIYLFLIIFAYKISFSVALLYGFFPENQQVGQAMITMIFMAPFFLIVFIPTFFILLLILFLVLFYLFRSNFFKSFSSKYNGFTFWIILGTIPYLLLPYLNFMVDMSRQNGYVNMKGYREKVQESNEAKREAYSEKLLNATKEEAIEAVKVDAGRLAMLNERYRKDKDVVYEAVKQDPYKGLNFADGSFRKDRELMSMAISINAYTFCQADKELRADKAFALAALNGEKHSRNVFGCMAKSLQNNREVILASIRKHPSITLRQLSSSFKKDKEIVLEAVKRKGFALNNADSSLKRDREVVLTALKQSGYALQYVDSALKKDREIVLTALRTNGGALRYVTDEEKADKELVLIAVQNSQESYVRPLQYADINLLDDKEIALASVKHNGLSLEQLSMSMKSNREVVLAAIRENKYAITYASYQLQEELK